MRLIIFLLALGVLSPLSARAATLESVLSTLAIPSDASYSANDWSSLNVRGVKWDPLGLRSLVGGVFSKSGMIKLDRLGLVSIVFSGARTMVFQVDVNIRQGEGNIFEKKDFDSVLRSQFGSQTFVRRIRGACHDEGVTSGSSVYSVSFSGKKPIYLLVSTDGGGNSSDSRSSAFQASLQLEDRWACSPAQVNSPSPQRNAAPAPTIANRGEALFGNWICKQGDTRYDIARFEDNKFVLLVSPSPGVSFAWYGDFLFKAGRYYQRTTAETFLRSPMGVIPWKEAAKGSTANRSNYVTRESYIIWSAPTIYKLQGIRLVNWDSVDIMDLSTDAFEECERNFDSGATLAGLRDRIPMQLR